MEETEKKTFYLPEMQFISMLNEDIIVTSGGKDPSQEDNESEFHG